MTRPGWRFWIDRGGTFTDVVACAPSGELLVRKRLSDPPRPADGTAPQDPAVAALRELLDLKPDQPIPPGLVSDVRLGTTVATNALLERQGAPVLLLVTRGFADLQRIGDQHRPDLFALEIRRPEPPPLRVIEVGGRLAADGQELEPLELDEALETALAEASSDGYRSVAVALLHAGRHPGHEQVLGSWLASRGFAPVVLSNRLSRQPRLVPRLDTSLLEASLAPVLGAYLDQVRAAIGAEIPLRVMTSAGALRAPALLQAKDTILSGPAGGMVAAVAVAAAAGFGDAPILGFDMGGTSSDVFHFDGSRGEAAWERSNETEIDGLRLLAPMLPIHTVAAGGGSVLQVQDGRLQVGPRSAGANPGPACYGRGGPLAITDANLLLGRLPVQALPRLFGPGGDQAADRGVVVERFEALAHQLGVAGPEAAAQGALTIAIERMAEAIRRISIQRGHDLRGAVLVTFGSAGGQLTCPLANALGLTRVLLHPLAGVLSAYGIGLARPSLLRERTLRQPLGLALFPQLERAIEALVAEATAELRACGDLAPGQAPRWQARLELRYRGSDQGLELPWPADSPEGVLAELHAGFEALHQQRFGFVVPDEPLVVERLQVEVSAPAPETPAGDVRAAERPEAADPPEPSEWVPLCLAEAHGGGTGAGMAWRLVPLWRREQLAAGQRIEGPALVVEPTGTTVLEPGWGGRVLAGGELLLERQAPGTGAALTGTGAEPVDPVRLELYNHRFSAIAEQMGERLRQCSRSVNIRERLDFSCALFDGAGRLVANAPHIPVHLGSMGDSVASLLAAVAAGSLPPLAPGDAYTANDPFDGGTHLPDITVITPVFPPEGGSAPLLFVACRGHHADVGGLTPGSMPPFSRCIEEEGLLLRHVPLLRQGEFDADGWRQRLAAGPHPVRNPDQLLADLQAQVAANRLGVGELQRLLARDGTGEVSAYLGHVLANAEEAVAEAIAGLTGGDHSVELDNGSRIVVAIRIDRDARRARIDFSGTSPQQEGNFNAPLAITKAAVLYVFRCLVGRAIPLNAGCFAPIELVVPEGCLLHPLPPAAVVAGNVETSQAVTNALFGALGVMAAAQGTMNNLSFGDAHHQYYETICGGTGAGVLADGSGFAGASAVQSHMTNSRLTDPEILEDRFPVRLERFAIRRGSGGAGHWPGGDGVIRRLRFLAPMTVAILSGSRRVPPFGLAGGGDGAVGRNRLQRADGRLEDLAGCDQVGVQPGDLLEIATPGGGRFRRSRCLAVSVRRRGGLVAVLLLVGLGAAPVPLARAQAVAPVAGAAESNVLLEGEQRFRPQWSARGLVAAQEPLASAAGAAILRQGGNAVDAAVATAFALAVTLPQAGNLGGGGFLLLWLPGPSPARQRGCLAGPDPELAIGGGTAVAVNFRETAPAAATATMFLGPDGQVDRTRATRSLLSTAVPGSVAGLALAQRCYGRLPLQAVMAPAIRLAADGFPVSRELSDSLAAAAPRLQADPASRRQFLPVPAPGTRLRQPLLAATLRRIATEGERGFSTGPVADALVAAMERGGGLITLGDLRAYRARLVRPLRREFRGHPVLTMPPPGGGLTLLQLLGILEPFDLAATGLNAAASLHRMAEAMNLAYRDRNALLGDPDQVPVPVERLLSPAHLDGLRRRIDPQRHTPAPALEAAAATEGTNTTHLSVADRHGGLVALTTTLNFPYGNGISVPGMGFLLNNEMDDFTARAGSANAFGLRQGSANAIAPGRRPLSSMAPTLVFRPDGRPWIATGSPGGSRIITTLLQVLLNRMVHGLNLASAVAAPRIHSQLWPDRLDLEQGVSPDTRRLLEAMGHRVRQAPAMGAANSVEVLEGGGSLGTVDPRRAEGPAVAE